MGNELKSKLNIKWQYGYSLIELLIAIPLGLLVVLAVFQVFSANITGVSMENAFSRVQENGRMAMDLITRDIRTSDYWGCVNDNSAIINNLNSADSDYDVVFVPSAQESVTGVNDVGSALTITDIRVKEGTDTLTLRGGDLFSSAKIKLPYMTATTSNIYFTAGSSISEGDLLLISDCESADLFTNTSTSDGIISHGLSSSAANSIDNASVSFSKIYGVSAQIVIPFIKTYFIGENSAGDYSLYRLDNNGDVASELVRGVNDLQLTYGEDTDHDGSADTFSNATSVSDMGDVISIKVQLVAVSGNGVSGTALQRTYTVTANIRNRSLASGS